MDASLAMLALLVRRVPFAVPAAKGFAPIPKIGRAAVHGYIPGYPLDLTALQPAHPVTAELGRLAADAAAAVGAEICGVDLLEDPDGRLTVLEVNDRVEFAGFQRLQGIKRRREGPVRDALAVEIGHRR